MRRIMPALFLLFSLPTIALSQTVQRQSLAKFTKLAEFEGIVRAERGKIVIVYCWASYNGPAIQQYLHFDKLRAKLGPNGISAFSACLDPEIDSERKKNIDLLLLRLKASCPCFLPTDGCYFWEEKLKIHSNPSVIVVDQTGRRTILDLWDDDTNLMERAERLVNRLRSPKK